MILDKKQTNCITSAVGLILDPHKLFAVKKLS